MTTVRDEARARIAARMVHAGWLVGPGAADRPAGPRGAPVTQRADTLAEERALRPAGAGDGAYWWPRAGGAGTASAAGPAISRPRLAARQAGLEAAAWSRTPRPGEGRAP